MEIKTLENTSIPEITRAFNEAFSDYIIPAKWTEEIVVRKFKGDRVDLTLSPGYFVDGRLSGFIFHGIGQREGRPIVWNGGTGVVPSQRGKGVTSRLYDFIIPLLRARGFDRTVLEVIVGNDPAIHIYKKNGFEKVRHLMCYKGTPEREISLAEAFSIRMLEGRNWELLHGFRSWQPTFQNDDRKIDALDDQIQILGAFQTDRLIGYIAFDQKPEAGDVFQFAVHPDYRRKGIGTALFATIAKHKSVPLKIINVDAAHTESIAFFEKAGFQKSVEQLEMIKHL